MAFPDALFLQGKPKQRPHSQRRGVLKMSWISIGKERAGAVKRRILHTCLAVFSLVIFCLAAFGFVHKVSREWKMMEQQKAEIAANLSYQMVSFRASQKQLTIDGYFCNENSGVHLQDVKTMMIFVRDMQGNEIACHFIGEEVLKTLRIPEESRIPYTFTVSPYPFVEKNYHTKLGKGIQLAFVSDYTTGECSGEDCAWCYPEGKRS